ncbi:MAG: TonB-dependent receptor [Cellulophaga sp.]
MNKKIYLLLFLLPFFVKSQTTITGHVNDKKGKPIALVNIYLKDIFDGSITNNKGNFTFSTNIKGKATLSVSSLGYLAIEKEIIIGQEDLLFDFTLQETANYLEEVVISAGVFDASDEKKVSILKPLDIVTNPGANGDIYAALGTLPGVTPVGNKTGLFVRGGEASETKTIIDGTLVTKPFFSSVPDIPSRGRFDPFLFKGTLFSTGGYSAQYGQALSSVLVLNTNDMPSKSSYSFDINMAGLGASYTKVWKEKTALFGSLGYTNLSTLFALVPQNRNWDKAPNGVSATFGFRHLTKQGGLYKSFLQYGNGDIALNFQNNGSESPNSQFSNTTKNLF